MDDLICVPDIGGLEERLLTRTEKRARAARRLLEAAEANNTQRVLTLLKDEADPTAEDAGQWSALQWAVLHGNEELIRELLRYGAAAPLLLQEQQQQQPPVEALPWQVLPQLQQRLLQEQHRSQSEKYQGKYSSAELPQENTSSPTRVTPVDGATTEGGAVERPAAQSLAATEAAAPQQQQQEAEPHQAAQPLELEPLPAPSALSDVIATKEASADSKEQPLHWAAYKGATRIFHVLLKAGFSPHVMDSLGNTVLHQAAAGGSLEMVKAVLSLGIPVEKRNARGHTAAAIAAEAVQHFWVYTSPEATECEQLVTWCNVAQRASLAAEKRLLAALEERSLEALQQAARDTEDYPLDCRLGKLLKTETKRLAIEAQIRRILKLVVSSRASLRNGALVGAIQEAEKQHQRQQENPQDVQEDAALKLKPDRLSKPLEGEGGQREENELPPETGEPSNKHDPQHMLQLDLQDDSQLMDELASLVIEGVAACCNSTLMQQLQHCRRLLVAEKNLKDLLRCLRRSNECPEPSFYERLCLSWEETRAISSEPELLEEAAAEASRAARHMYAFFLLDLLL
ncbi:uncharacterized protein LOC34624238 [Cyclospora cayetanensis]|uniref:Uncharacterized protein LOC34624238 n=1 Tax=Cyclospora cayetanensis TaxID=88456 RepID=A0A6P6RYB7_9EIME|nr:uncharacterized protein LOC34624238 [Cyclospora cayetanensis]